MSTWIFVVGLIVFSFGVGKYLGRKEDHRFDLERLERERREAKFWGWDTDEVDRQRKEKLAEQASWKARTGDWGLFAAGVVICAISGAVWLAEDPSRTLDQQAWDKVQSLVTGFVILGFGLWGIYQLLKRLDKADHEIKWLNQMLKVVKDHAEDMRKGSIDNFVELRDRLDRLEGGASNA